MHKYKDININITKSYDYDYDAIIDCVENILSTRKGTVPLKRDFGIDLEKYLFDPFISRNVAIIESDITRNLLKFCPQLEILAINLEQFIDDGILNIDIKFKAKGIDSTYSTKKQLYYAMHDKDKVNVFDDS